MHGLEDASMNKKMLGYWAFTGLTAFAMAGGGLMNASRSPEIVASYASLGYPDYMPVLIGVWKVLAAVALLAPGFARIKEWAYAGIGFAMTGAFISHVVVGDPAAKAVPPLFVLAFAIGSYVLRPASRRLDAPAPEPRRAEALTDAVPSRA